MNVDKSSRIPLFLRLDTQLLYYLQQFMPKVVSAQHFELNILFAGHLQG